MLAIKFNFSLTDYIANHKKQLITFSLFLLTLILTTAYSGDALAGGAGSVDDGEAFFKEFYEMIEGAATGYLGRGLAIAGGIVGLAYGAGQGRAMIAGVGVVLAVFGALGPAIIDGIFTSALI